MEYGRKQNRNAVGSLSEAIAAEASEAALRQSEARPGSIADAEGIMIASDKRLESEPSAIAAATIGGVVEIYGRHEAAACWVFGGWIPRTLQTDIWLVTAVFERGNLSGEASVAFYERVDLLGHGIGFLVVLPIVQRGLGRLMRLESQLGSVTAAINAAADARELHGTALIDRSEAIAAVCSASAKLAMIRNLVSRRFLGEGYLDAYGYHLPSAGWFVCGWVSSEWVAYAKQQGEASAQFEAGNATGPMVLNFYDREDVRDKGVGFILHLSTADQDLGRLLLVTLRAGAAVVVARPSATLSMIAAEFTAASFLDLIIGSDRGAPREHLRDLAARTTYHGQDTVINLDGVFIEFDEVIACPPDSVALIGWMLARPGAIQAMRLRSAFGIFPIDMAKSFHWTDRPDVIASIGRDHGFDDPGCGFIARVPTPHHTDEALYLEIETPSGELAYKPVPRGGLVGVPALQRLLGEIDVQYTNVDALYDNVFGPAVAALNASRLQARPRVSTLQLGPPVIAPRYSVIVPLYGRIDLMQMQMALFATLGIGDHVELIYVLDDPPKTREAQFLAASLHARFKLPFKLLCLSRNMGFAPANNIGLAAATGKFVCFLNSDVFPTTGDWLYRLAAHLDADPSLGVVGPLLLFEDGSVQHKGIFFKSLPQYGNWLFPHHTRKGFRRPDDTGLRRQQAITGAAMLLRRDTALHCGGFDEAFIIGDFEDTDLCFKLAQAGLGAAVDLGVAMYHLERKSQASSASAWRNNLTLHNAWVHQRRWAETIARLPTTR